MNLESSLKWAEAHPIPTTVGVLVVGLGVLWLMGAFGGGSSGSSADATGAAAYYAAQAAQAQAGDQLAAVQTATAAQTAQTKLNDEAQVTINQTWAGTDLAEVQSNNAAAQAIAPYATEQALIGTLGSVASLPATTTTTTKSSSGFLGIGGGSSTSTKVTPNPAAVAAANELEQLMNGFAAGH